MEPQCPQRKVGWCRPGAVWAAHTTRSTTCAHAGPLAQLASCCPRPSHIAGRGACGRCTMRALCQMTGGGGTIEHCQYCKVLAHHADAIVSGLSWRKALVGACIAQAGGQSDGGGCNYGIAKQRVASSICPTCSSLTRAVVISGGCSTSANGIGALTRPRRAGCAPGASAL